MGRRKYNAPENVKKWAPIVSKNVKEDCEYLVKNKCLFGCIYENFIKEWNKLEKFILSCIDCTNYKQKVDDKKVKSNEKKEKKGKTTRKQKSKKEKDKRETK